MVRPSQEHEGSPPSVRDSHQLGDRFFEYCIQVPANRIGAESYTLPQLKIIQEIITMAVFAGFAILYMKTPVTRNYLYASICMMGAAWFIFRD